MGFRTGAYAKVWEVTPMSDTSTKVRMSVSRKNKQTGEYEQDFRCSKSYSYKIHLPKPIEFCPKKNMNALGAEAKICSIACRSLVVLCDMAL